MTENHNTVLVASNNAGKIAEIIENLELPGWRFLPLNSFGAAIMPEETGATYEENARIKAWAAREWAAREHSSVLATLADDSGLEVDALGGAPGVRSARYGGEQTTDVLNTAKLLEELKTVPDEARRARFVCCVVYVDTDGHEIVARGSCEGRIAQAPRGKGGFGYDPVFLPDEVDDGRTMAELSPEEKDKISHRGKALRALREQLAICYGAPTTKEEPVRLAAFDFDGTLLEGHSPVRMVRSLLRRNIIPYRVALQALWWGVRYRLRIPVEQKEVREHIFRSFSHFPAAEADQLMSDFYRADLRRRLRPRGLEAVKKHREAGEQVVLVSASFTPILKEASHDLGADWFICTQMEVKDGYYTGNVMGQPPEGAQKLVQLAAWADATYHKDGWALVAAYGDHRSDEPLLAAAREAIAVNPDSGLEKAARRHGWRILDWSFECKL
ncbi:MAG: RdgB/HAM1 family non-canonical purine NTP pyrophosphatase [Coriobacteriales bacterium]|jgi:XTP/dITP diphosphohydrolase|nr:RdgB/HAM1 family non-canonical purine NTP pyrophosphatase [Coriobacteriales bacterium]